MRKQRHVPTNVNNGCARVAKIERIPRADVYNMEVDGTHCFAVNGGIIVHNCMDAVRYFVMTERIYNDKER